MPPLPPKEPKKKVGKAPASKQLPPAARVEKPKTDPKFPLYPVDGESFPIVDGKEWDERMKAKEKQDREQAETPLASLLRRSIEEVEANKDDAPHVIVIARAGVGKTVTLVEGTKILLGLPPLITPSDQQAAVWEAMKLSAGKVKSICFAAFNSTIAKELQRRVPPGCEAMTLHSLGMRAVNNNLGRFEVNQFRVMDLLAQMLNTNPHILRSTQGAFANAAVEIVGLCKVNLSSIDPAGNQLSPENPAWERVIEDLINYYDIDLEDSKGRGGNPAGVFRKLVQYVPLVIEACKDPTQDGCIDFDDMIWLPIVLDLDVPRFDFLLVDESQDLSKCQQALAKKAGKRLIFCGDDRQSVYAFAGADSDSIPRLMKELKQSDRGCIELPLTVTRRCGKRIVQEAAMYVPDFEAHESNPAGEVLHALYPLQKGYDGLEELPYEKTYLLLVQEGDFILCRNNAPLVSQCLKLIEMERKATILGRDLARSLVKTIEKQKASNVLDLIKKLEEWMRLETSQERAKRHPNEARISGFQDRFNCLMVFTKGVEQVSDVLAKIDKVFTDTKNSPGIRCSSIHKAKGMEAPNVFLLQPAFEKPRPTKTAWERKENENLMYVAITRAIERFYYVR